MTYLTALSLTDALDRLPATHSTIAASDANGKGSRWKPSSVAEFLAEARKIQLTDTTPPMIRAIGAHGRIIYFMCGET